MWARRRGFSALLWTLVAVLLAAGSLGSLLLRQLADVAGQQLVNPGQNADAALHGQWVGAEVALWLGLTAIGALGLALGLALLRLGLVGPLERLARLAQPHPSPADSANELLRIEDVLQSLRRDLGRDQADLHAQLGAAQALRDVAEQAVSHLQQADRLALVGRVAVGVAHEVGNPLAVLVASLDMLRQYEQDGAPVDDRMRCVERAEQAAQRIHTILADLSEPGLHQTRQKDRPCDLAAVALRVVQLAEIHPRCKQLQLTLAAGESSHPADASASHVEQILLNLVVNAADATAGLGHVHLSITQEDTQQVIAVADDGPGLPAGDPERLFEPFVSTKGQAGWGLGLAVSRRIAQGYGGTLTAQSPPAGGAEFTLRLPMPSAQRRRSRIQHA